MSVYKNTKKIISISLDTLWVILIYSCAIASLSLAIPISIQTLINVVSFGSLLQPIVVITLALFVILTIIGGIRVAQAMVVETIQQRIFTDIGIKLAHFLPSLKMANFDECRVLDLVNHFFEVPIIQKSLATLLVTGIEVSLMAFFSMVLVAFYHPLLLLFDILLIISLLLALILPWKKALIYSLKECEAKHSFVSWLEEVVHNIFLFKLQRHSQYALSVADTKLVNYLEARQKHFANILKHIISINVIYVIANTALLGIGGYLVLKEQLSLGQLVASELIINALLYGIIRFSFYLEDLYDLLASSNKVAMLFTMPSECLESPFKFHDYNIAEQKGLTQAPTLEAKNLAYLRFEKEAVFTELNFKINPSEKTAILGAKSSGKSVLIDILLGFKPFHQGTMRIDNVPIQDYPIYRLRNAAALVRQIEFFSGTLYENLVLHRTDITVKEIYQAIHFFKSLRVLFPAACGVKCGDERIHS